MLKKTFSSLCIGISLAVIPCAAHADDIEQTIVEQSALPAGFEHEVELELTAGVDTLATRCRFDREEQVTCGPVASGDDSDQTDLVDVTPSNERAGCWVTLEYCTPQPYCTCTSECSEAKCQSSCNSLYAETC